MKTIELTLATLGVGVLYGSYVYYLLESGNSNTPTNLWYSMGKLIDEFLFNSGVKPKEQIQDAPNRIEEYIDNY